MTGPIATSCIPDANLNATYCSWGFQSTTQFVKWCENNRARLEDGRWNVLERPYPLYPLWRTVSGADFPNIEWNARFYDKIETKPTYRDVVKGAICNNVLLLREELEHFVQENP